MKTHFLNFFSNPTWWLFLIFSVVIGCGLAFREAYRHRSMQGKYGILTTFGAAFLVLLWVGVIIFAVVETGWISGVIVFAVSFLVGNLLLAILRSKKNTTWEKLETEHDYEVKMIDDCIAKLLSSEEHLRVLNEFNMNKVFLEDFIKQLYRCGKGHIVHKLNKVTNLMEVLEIYSDCHRTEEDKIITASNFLEYRSKIF